MCFYRKWHHFQLRAKSCPSYFLLTFYIQQNYKNLIRFTRKMLESNLYDREIRDKLLLQVKETKKLAQKDWLISMLQKSR